ncbi:DUF4870 domain-containing protein [Staphylococcus kloosii]|uniref:DUF4870 domain-containing protein n=1 Tax=Staphylococcus kloosii TaxID=29384 RepID=UPI0028A3737A|nr:DUF4870 domain-containing protein [Staphylococcus kloosii]MDT3958711.1 DUF4870 domain-containing protein [Staphylococcus kloosii]
MTNNDAYQYEYEDVKQTLKTTSDERLMVMLIYILSFFTSFIGPLIIWLIRREASPFIDRGGKDYFNFLISYIIWTVVSTVLIFILIGFVLLPIVAILNLIFTIIAIVKASNGEHYLPPLSIRFIK